MKRFYIYSRLNSNSKINKSFYSINQSIAYIFSPKCCVFLKSSWAILLMIWNLALLKSPLLFFECLCCRFACLSVATFQSNLKLFSPSQHHRFFFLPLLFGEYRFCTIWRCFFEEFSAICWLMRKIFPLDAASQHWVSLECYKTDKDLSPYLKHPRWLFGWALEVFILECCSNLTFQSQCQYRQCPKSLRRTFEQTFLPSHQASHNLLSCHNLDSFMST